MPERAYTLAEIDRMRKAVETFTPHVSREWTTRFIGGYSGETMESVARANGRRARIEDELRTYMAGGVAAIEVEEKAAAIFVGRFIQRCLAPVPPPPPQSPPANVKHSESVKPYKDPTLFGGFHDPA